MRTTSFQDILPLVERPSRYLGSEINAFQKDFRKVRLAFALAFPDLYEIGTSHFGLQILYNILNRHPDIAAERIFAPAIDMEANLRSFHIPIQSLETARPLHRFDIIGFSLLYELNYTNLLTLLDLAGIPFYASQRDPSHPMIIAGGPSTSNPEPVADFFDAMVVGDGEVVIMKMAQAWLRWNEKNSRDKEILLKKWSAIEGVYIPSFFEPTYDPSDYQILSPKFSNYTIVNRAILKDLDKAPFPEAPVLPYGKPVHDRLRLEISRGCTRGCRFCQAGMIYRPVRERKPETLLALSEASLAATGYEDISLLSLSTGDYGCIVQLMQNLMDRGESNRTAISFPSMRAGTLTPQLMNLIKRVRKTGFTIAPEAGSQRLRNLINKNLSNEEIFKTVRHAFGLGWQVIKLYFMIGLPTETEDDLQALVELVNGLNRINAPKDLQRKRGRKINVSVATFIPKPHTPFQWAPQITLAESREKIFWLQNRLKKRGIHFKWQNPYVSFIEGVLSRGDRRLSRLLVAAYQRGCKFDGWSDMFKFESWQNAFEDAGLDVEFYVNRTRNLDEPLPWDHINTKVSKAFLKKEWEKAINGEPTPDCRNEKCNSCGVCDFKDVSPVIFKTCRAPSFQPDPEIQSNNTVYKTFKVSYTKQGPAKYFGHLEMVNIFLRALRRTGIPVKYSQGFHPKPKVSFADPLPIGLESLCEMLFITVPNHIKPGTVIRRLNPTLPEGLEVYDCRLVDDKNLQKKARSITYQIILKDGFFDEKALQYYNESSEAILEIVNRKGTLKNINLKAAILNLKRLSPNILQMTLKSETGKTVRPFEVVSKIFPLSQEAIKAARYVKIGISPLS